ncbi:MAG: hypothetical protein H7A25_18580 [Leptospiraceae bacterium]|nr:hypothetical protein [Leptospiraceae bacterium]
MATKELRKQEYKSKNFFSDKAAIILTYSKTLSIIRFKRRCRAITEKEKNKFMQRLSKNKTEENYRIIQSRLKKYTEGRILSKKFIVMDFILTSGILQISFLSYSFVYLLMQYWKEVILTGSLEDALYNCIDSIILIYSILFI